MKPKNKHKDPGKRMPSSTRSSCVQEDPASAANTPLQKGPCTRLGSQHAFCWSLRNAAAFFGSQGGGHTAVPCLYCHPPRCSAQLLQSQVQTASLEMGEMRLQPLVATEDISCEPPACSSLLCLASVTYKCCSKSFHGQENAMELLPVGTYAGATPEGWASYYRAMLEQCLESCSPWEAHVGSVWKGQYSRGRPMWSRGTERPRR